MPIYEYVCNRCRKKFELMRSFSRSQEGASCPHCAGYGERILSACYTKTTNDQGITEPVGGSSCSSCSGGSCSSCHN